MKTKIQIKSYFGSVLFEHESEENTVKKTVEEAVKNRAFLDGAFLNGASLNGASLNGASLAWTSHDLLAEILKRAASNDIEKLKVAGLLLVKRDWCWKDFLKLNDKNTEWALAELAKWAKADTPGEIRKILGKYGSRK